MQLWQYQALSEPLSTLSETITLDKWFFHPQEPARRRPNTARIVQGFDEPYLRQETFSPEVFAPTNAPYLKLASRRHLYPNEFRPIDTTFTEAVSVDRFMPMTPPLVFRHRDPRYLYPSVFTPHDRPALNDIGMFLAAIDQTPIPFLRHRSRISTYPSSAFKEPSVLFFPCPPPTDWTPEDVNITDWGTVDPIATDWSQGMPREVTSLNYNAAINYNYAVYYNGYDPSILDGQLFNPKDTDWSTTDPQGTDWTERAAGAQTTWEECGGSDG